MTLARRLATPRGGLIALAVVATVGFFAILTVVEQSCGDCAVPTTGAAMPDVLTESHQAPPPTQPAASPPPTQPAPSSQPETGTAAQASAPDTDSSTPPASADAGSSPPSASADTGNSAQPAPDEAGGATPPASAEAGAPTPTSDTSEPPVSPSAPAPPSPDIAGAANYVRAFYADLAKGNFRAAWPRLAADLRAEHGTLSAWQRGFSTTVRQSTSDITAKSTGPNAALVTLTLTAVDRDKCGHEVERHFAVTWRLELSRGKWRAPHAAARPLGKAPTAQMASACA